jgi:plastocyanin
MAQTHDVAIKSMKYQPNAITVASGDTIRWTNRDAMQHTVTADNGSFDSGGLAKDDTFTQLFDNVGTVAYHCDFHANMTATVTVG